MALDYETSRLSVFEATRDIIKSEESALLVRVPELLTPQVVESLPPYFHNIASPADAKVWFERMMSESTLLIVKENNAGSLIGFVFVFVENECDAHIGYLLGEAYWGQGLATELLRGFLKQVTKEQKWVKLIGGVDRNNKASLKLLSKLGFIESKDSDGQVVFFEYQLYQPQS